jgi:hypothetical protein
MTRFAFTLAGEGQIEDSTGETEMGKIPGHSQLMISRKYISHIIASFLCTLPLAATYLIPGDMTVSRRSKQTQSRALIFDDCRPSLRRPRSINSGFRARTGSVDRPPAISNRCAGHCDAVSFSVPLELAKLVDSIHRHRRKQIRL